jgi:hypothetical protein
MNPVHIYISDLSEVSISAKLSSEKELQGAQKMPKDSEREMAGCTRTLLAL